MNIEHAAMAAKIAARTMAAAPAAMKNRALTEIGQALQRQTDRIVLANQQDLARARQDQLAAPLRKRLRFDSRKIAEARAGLQSLIALDDPVGQTLDARELDDGLELYRVTCPIGVVGIIFESRPDALVQISSLCLKSGNAVLLKGGSEAAETNRVLADIVADAGCRAGMPAGWLTLLETRSDVAAMLDMDACIDLLIPRGSNAFVRYIMDHTHIPVLGHADGICHVYVDSQADMAMAADIVVDSKSQYVAVCNAAETLLVHAAVAEAFLPRIQSALKQKGVEIRGCRQTCDIIDVCAATESDWDTEYLDSIISIKVVKHLTEAIDHIDCHGSGHTEVIVTADSRRARQFMDEVDAACVFVNCSSRFSDGYRFGLGAEVGISTSKLHARGPVGLEGLLSYKWRLIGRGHVVADYAGGQARAFTHRRLERAFDIDHQKLDGAQK